MFFSFLSLHFFPPFFQFCLFLFVYPFCLSLFFFLLASIFFPLSSFPTFPFFRAFIAQSFPLAIVATTCLFCVNLLLIHVLVTIPWRARVLLLVVCFLKCFGCLSWLFLWTCFWSKAVSVILGFLAALCLHETAIHVLAAAPVLGG